MRNKTKASVFYLCVGLFVGWMVYQPTAQSFAQTASRKCPENPDKSGTFTLEGQKRGIFVAFRQGEGVLTLNNGQQVEFTVRGLKFGETGSSTVRIKGDVYGLQSLEDFVGHYEGVAGGFLPMIERKDVQVVNSNCVTLVAKVVESGLRYSLVAGQSFLIEFPEE
ncbi:hypothetical protein [Ruegeria lacuscaerulensis]|nr:hypothetical protein [Ruegeria lacuscaerulensis]